MLSRWILALGSALMIVISNLSWSQPVSAAIRALGAGGCPSNTVVGGDNLVQNGDFSQGATGFETDLINRGASVYPDDTGGGGFSIQQGPIVYPPFEANPFIFGRPFPGDLQRDAPATNSYFYSNPSADDYQRGNGRVNLWRQQVTVAPNTTYNFFAYFDNLLDPVKSANGAADPVIELRVNNQSVGTTVVPKTPDRWVPIQFVFATNATTTSIWLQIDSLTNHAFGDDFAMTQISLKQCVTGVGAAKYAFPPEVSRHNNQDGYRIEYLITLRNMGADPVSELQVTDNLAAVFAQAVTWELLTLEPVNESGLVTLSVNPAFNGQSDLNLLAENQSLAAGQLARLRLVVWVQPPSGAVVFQNSVEVTARSGNVLVTDISVPGLDPDPNETGDPKDTNDVTVSIITPYMYRIPIVLR